jgi:hypothetical protein
MSAADEIAAVRERLAANRDLHREPAHRTAEDFAEARPELHERIERLRAENPGLAAPPMQEPEPPPPAAPACDPTNEAEAAT